MATYEYDELFWIILVGEECVGKSCILSGFTESVFSSKYVPTIGSEFKIKTLDVDGKKIKLLIMDTAGKEQFRVVTPAYYRKAKGVMLVYDVTCEKSFDSIKYWIRKLEELTDRDVRMILCGNKCDLSDARVISEERGQSLAEKYGMKFMETSAQASINVEEAFLMLAKDIKAKTVKRNESDYNPTVGPESDDEVKMLLFHNLNKAREDHRTIPVRFLKVAVAGSGAVGKTNFINLLMKRKFEEGHHSTNIVRANHAVSFQMGTFQESSKVDDVAWFELDSKLIICYLKSILLQLYPNQKSPVSSSQATETVPSGSTKTSIKPLSKIPKQQSSPLHRFIELFTASNKHSSSTAVDSIVYSKSFHSGVSSYQPGRVLNIITFLDTGGLSEYINLLPTISNTSKVTFIVHNLSKNLDDQVLMEYSQHGKHMFTPYHLSYSNLDMIKFLTSTVNDSMGRPACSVSDSHLVVTPGSDDKSYICMVGTHADKVSLIEKKNTSEKLNSLVCKTCCHASSWHRENKSVLFPVDNTIAGGRYPDDPTAKDIRSRIEVIASKQEVYNLPITWVLLQLEIQQVCSKRSKSYILFDDCLAIATESGLISSIEEVKSVLQYYHRLGLLLYFQKVPGLCDYVILDHHWWFNKLSRIICITFKDDFLSCKAVQKLKYQGLLSMELMEHIEWKDDIKKEYFFSLLIHMKIIAKVSIKDEYFIPFVLSTHGLLQHENKVLSQYGHLQGDPLLFQFCSGVLPRGLFCFLIVELLQQPLKEAWEPQFSQEDTQQSFSNLFTFSLPNAYSLSLLDKLSYLEVQIRHPKKEDDVAVHAKVYSYLLHNLKQVCNHLKFNYERLHFGFLCKCCKYTEDHIAILPSVSSSMAYAECSMDNTQQMKLSSAHLIWFCLHDQPL